MQFLIEEGLAFENIADIIFQFSL